MSLLNDYEWMNDIMDEWMNGWMNGWMNKYDCLKDMDDGIN